MPLSRLRLRLAGSFALAFLAGLLLLSLSLFAYARRQSDTRLTRELATEAQELVAAIQIEYQVAPDSGLAGAVDAALEEWPPRPEAFGIYALDGRRLARTGPGSLADALPEEWSERLQRPLDLLRPSPARRLVGAMSTSPGFRVAAVGTMDRVRAESETLAIWLVVSIPVTALLSLIAGYLLSSHALGPVADLQRGIDRLGPDALDQRLPVHRVPDELDRLAERFNALLARLQDSHEQNRHFLERAAHQIRTPLTLVLGEADLAAERGTPEARREALRRIRMAATLMRRRVEELMLLARASAGERPPLTDRIELDGLAFESADLMRGRATQLGRRLELTRLEPIVLGGSEPLLREAVVELLENACRHGTDRLPIGLSVYRENGHAVIEVSNATSPGPAAPEVDSGRPSLGLEVVRWIVTQHGGVLRQRQNPELLQTIIELPA